MIEVHLAVDRYESVQEGITTRHCFAAGANYDPHNLNFGPIVASDEHRVGPGAGFGRHPHRGVDILSWVLDGRLVHEDAAGARTIVSAGEVLVQVSGPGIEHAERNASDTSPLHFVQMAMRADSRPASGGDPPSASYGVGVPPVPIAGGSFAVVHPHPWAYLPAAAYVHVYLARGRALVDGRQVSEGDSVRLRDESVLVEGDADLLVLSLPAPTVEG
ncbi:MAG: pirin family protein [Actinomycetota bacterium]|nr:pirin family protein [Actinomycetota bacterium]